MNRFRLVAAAIACAIVQQASAADMPSKSSLLRSPSAILTASWAGLYVGGHAGYAWLDGKYLLNDGLIEQFNPDPSGFTGGGQIGAQAQWGHIVFGLEGTYSWADISQSQASAFVPGKTAALDVRQISTISGRLGWAEDRWMVYGKAGVAWGRFHTTDVNVTPAALTFDTSVWETGYVLGLGVDYMWAPSWVIGAELDYYAFRFNRQFQSGGAVAAIHDSSADILTLMLRVSYLFNMRW
jgi:outer membrane immunogenic protein